MSILTEGHINDSEVIRKALTDNIVTADRFIVWWTVVDRQHVGWPKDEARHTVVIRFASGREASFFFRSGKKAQAFFRHMITTALSPNPPLKGIKL